MLFAGCCDEAVTKPAPTLNHSLTERASLGSGMLWKLPLKVGDIQPVRAVILVDGTCQGRIPPFRKLVALVFLEYV